MWNYTQRTVELLFLLLPLLPLVALLRTVHRQSHRNTEGAFSLCSCFSNRWCIASSSHSALINFKRFLVLWRTVKSSTSSGHSLRNFVLAEYCPNLHAVGSRVNPVCHPLHSPHFSSSVPQSYALNQFYSSDVAEQYIR